MKSKNTKFNWGSFISEHSLFGELTLPEISSLTDSINSTEKKFEPDKVIFRAGEISNSFYIIGDGSVNVELSSEDSNATNICTLYKGDFFGEMSAIDNQQGRAATIVANEKCTLLEIKSKPFLQILKQKPELEFKLLSMLTARLRHVNDHLLKSTRLTYDTKFSILSEKIESQSKVVAASLQASQAVFEQTKIRTDEIIHSAERGRSRITWILSTLTAGFTLLLALFSFFGYDKLNSAEQKLLEIEVTKTSILKTKADVEKTKKEIETAKTEVDKVSSTIARLSLQSENLSTTIIQLRKSIAESESAKRILFETLISMFFAQVEEIIMTGVGDVEKLGLRILESNDPIILFKFYEKLFYGIEDSLQSIAYNLKITSNSGPGLDQKERLELVEVDKLNQARITYLSIYMNQYISAGNELIATTPVAVFLSHYILLVTNKIPDQNLSQNPGSFNVQLQLLKNKYLQLDGDEIKQQLYNEFISNLDPDVSTVRFKAVNQALSEVN